MDPQPPQIGDLFLDSIEHVAPAEVGLFTGLNLFADAFSECLLQCVFTAGIDHLLLDLGLLRSPTEANNTNMFVTNSKW